MTRHPCGALVGAALALALSATPAPAQSFQSCDPAMPGVCGQVQAMLTGSTLTVRVQNQDASANSFLFHAFVGFANALGNIATGPFSGTAAVTTSGPVQVIGNTAPAGTPTVTFSGGGGSTAVDFFSSVLVTIEGSSPSPFRASPGSTSSGTFVTLGAPGESYVQFTADLTGVSGISGNSIDLIGFETSEGIAFTTVTAVVATPEPSSMVLLASGLLGLGFVVPRRRRAAA
jgi:hypothetical protein